ncbi:MAG: TlpA family protein disulfide reductase [Cyclobacteriaceae bacterium]|nr:TlpA family protein disulfide reductase [Cyclobacteriaceae bacterium]MBX2955125.1 TlpA family protein disulfide reductase [Cyclobacteriaceae bacterium]
MKRFIPLLSLILLIVVYFIGFNSPAAVSLKDEAFNYKFTLKTLDGDNISIETLRGKVIFLNMWATWCGPCRKEMPGIQKLYEKTKSDDIVFVMLSVDKEGDQNKVASYLKRNSFTFPVYMPTANMSTQLNVPSIPTTFIISKDGKIAHQKVGSTNYDSEKYKSMLLELAAQ